MSWLGSLWNAAKVGVNLLNGIMNPQSGAASDLASALQLNPAAAIRVEESGETHRIVSIFVAVSGNPARVGKTFHLFEGGLVDDGEIVFATVQDPSGALNIQVINNSTATDYYINFGQTNAVAGLSTQNLIVGRKGGDIPNMINVSSQFEVYSLGNLVVTPVETTASLSAFQSPSIPLSTVLGNVGFASIIAGASFLLYKSSAGKVTIEWNKTASGTGIGSYLVKNDTEYAVTISANVNWTNPAIAATVNVKVGPGGRAEGSLPENSSPISSASVCAFTESTSTKDRKKIVRAVAENMRNEGVTSCNVKFAKTGKCTPRASSNGFDGDLTAKDKQILAALKAIGGDDVLLKLGNGTKQKKSSALAQITFEDD